MSFLTRISFELAGFKPMTIMYNNEKVEGMGLRKGNHIYFRDGFGLYLTLKVEN